MSKIDCNIIRDLLPGYSDKILSETSNQLVREHLQICNNCLKEYQEMNKEIPQEFIKNQDEQIDYLKGFKKNKTKSIIIAILTTLYVLTIGFGVLLFYDSNTMFEYPIEELEGTLIQEHLDNKVVWNLHINNIKHSFCSLERYTTEGPDGSKIIHIKFVGDHPIFGIDLKGSRTVLELDIDEKVEKICFENVKDTRVIWNRSDIKE